MSSPKQPTQIIDKNGKQTTVHKNVDSETAARTAPAPKSVQENPYRFLKNPEFMNSLTHAVDYEFDGYYCSGCEGVVDDYCRDSQYHGLRVEYVDAERVLAYLFQCSQSQLPADLIEFAEDIGVGEIENYEAVAEGGIYGEEAAVTMDRSVHEELMQWYLDLPEAVDRGGILEYCRQRGVKTSGLSPLEAIKSQLAAENPGRSSARVDRAKSASVQKILLSGIDIPNTKYLDSIEGGEEYTTTLDGISGVVSKEGGGYALVDGYHRLKQAKQSKKTKGTYIVLG